MTSTNNIVLLTIALAALLVLLGVNYVGQTGSSGSNSGVIGSLTLDPKEVRGVAVEKEGKIFTLNLKQQTEVLGYINSLLPVDKKDYVNAQQKFNFSRLIVYRFDKPDAILIPIALQNKGIVFDVPLLNSSSYMFDPSGGKMQALLEKASAP